MLRYLLLVLLLVSILSITPSVQAQDDLVGQVQAAVKAAYGPASEVRVSDVQYAGDWAFGSAVIPAPPNHGSPQLYLFLAQRTTTGWQVALDHTRLFASWVLIAPTSLISAPARAMFANQMNVTADGSAQLGLPFGVGEAWYYWSGPHSNNGSGTRPWNALDFGLDYPALARAAQDGVVWRSSSCPNYIRIDHTNGWSTGYYHLINEMVTNGQQVQRGEPLGTISEAIGCGGFAVGDHVHFSLWRNGTGVEMHDKAIGGWVIQEGSSQYEGCAQRLIDGYGICLNAPIYNAGVLGDGMTPANTRRFNFSLGLQGWTPNTQLGGGQVDSAGGVGFRILGNDPRLYSPLLSLSAAYKDVKIRLANQNDTCASIYFRRTTDASFSEDRRVDFTLTTGPTAVQYTVDMSQNPNWNGTIQYLRLDPACSRNSDPDRRDIRLEQIEFSAPRPAAPILLTPPHRATVGTSSPLFSWTVVENAVRYRIFLFDDKDPKLRTVDIRENVEGPVTSHTLSVPLTAGRYFWRVRARVDGVWSRWSMRFMVRVDGATSLDSNSPPGITVQDTPTLLPPPNSRDSQASPVPTVAAPPTSLPTPVPTIVPTGTPAPTATPLPPPNSR